MSYLNEQNYSVNPDNYTAQRLDDQPEPPINTKIIHLSSKTYESTLYSCKTKYESEKALIHQAIKEILTLIPGSLIRLTFIIDLSKECPEFFRDFRIEDILRSVKNSNELVNLLFCIYFLEQYGFFRCGEFKKLVEKNSLDEIEIFLEDCKIGIGLLNSTRNAGDKNYDVEIGEFTFDESIRNISDVMEVYNLVKNMFVNVDGDAMVARQLIYSFSWSYEDCKAFLLHYFYKREYRNLVFGILIAVKEKRIDNVFMFCLFIQLTASENFLKTFYEIVPEIINSQDEDLNIFLRHIFSFIYEKYYFSVKMQSSEYVNNVVYDPSYRKEERHTFFRLLNEDIVNEMVKISEERELVNYLEDKSILKISEVKEIKACEVDLKQMINSNKFDEIRALERDVFFRAFFFIAQHSISHFLTYMEILADCFVMSEEEQNQFYGLFVELFEGRDSFKKFVCGKMVLFGVIDKAVMERNN